MSGRNGRQRAALGGLALAGLIVSASYGEEARQPNGGATAQHDAQQVKPAPPAPPAVPQNRAPYKPRCEAPKDADEATLCQEREAVDVAREANRISAQNFWLSLLALGALIWTLFETRRAATAATEAVKAIPILEAAYPFVVIESLNIKRVLSDAATAAPHIAGPEHRPSVNFSIKNYGATPATILGIEIDLLMMSAPAKVHTRDTDHIPNEVMLNTGDTSDIFTATLGLPLYSPEALRIMDGRYALRLSGFVNYSDIWNRRWSVNCLWRYNVTQDKLTLVAQGRQAAIEDRETLMRRLTKLLALKPDNSDKQQG